MHPASPQRVVTQETEVFISYRHGADPDSAHELAKHLEKRCRVFIDDEMHAGTELPQRLRKEIDSAAVAVMVVTPGYFDADRYWIAKEIAHVESRREQAGLVIVPALSGTSVEYLTASGHADWPRIKYVDLARFDHAVEDIVRIVEECRKLRAHLNVPALARAVDGVATISADSALESIGLHLRLPDAARGIQWLIATRVAERRGLLGRLLERVVVTAASPWDPRIPFVLSRGTLMTDSAQDAAWAAGRVAELRTALGDDALVDTLCSEALRRVAPDLWQRTGSSHTESDFARAVARAPRRWVDASGTFADVSVGFALAARALSSSPEAIQSAIEAPAREDVVLLTTIARWDEAAAQKIAECLAVYLAHRPLESSQRAVDAILDLQLRRLRVLADAGRSVEELQARAIDWALRAGRDAAVPAILGETGERNLAVYAVSAERVSEEPRRALIRAVIALAAAPGADLSAMPYVTRRVVEAALDDSENVWNAIASDDRALLLWCAVAGPDLTKVQVERLANIARRPRERTTDSRIAAEAQQALDSCDTR